MKWDWQKFEGKLSDWLVTNVPKITVGILVLLIGLWLTRLLSKWIKKAFTKKRFDPSLRYFLENLIAIILQILVVFLAMQIAGIQLSFFTAILAGLTVAGGLALSGTLQNFVSGVLILVLKPYRVDDIVVIQGQQGKVTSIQLFYTNVLTHDNKTIIVPNGQLSNNVVINLSREGNRRIDINLKFPFKIDEKHVREVIVALLTSDNGILEDPPFRIGIADLEADKYVLTVQVWTKAHGFEDTRLALQEKILDELRKNQLVG